MLEALPYTCISASFLQRVAFSLGGQRSLTFYKSFDVNLVASDLRMDGKKGTGRGKVMFPQEIHSAFLR